MRRISGDELEPGCTRRPLLGRISGDEPELSRISGRLSAAAWSSLSGVSSEEGSVELAGSRNASGSDGVQDLPPRDMHMRMGARTAQLPTLSLRDTPDTPDTAGVSGKEAAPLGSGYNWTAGDPLGEGAPGNLGEGDADEILGVILRGPSGDVFDLSEGDPGEILPEESLGEVVTGQ